MLAAKNSASTFAVFTMPDALLTNRSVFGNEYWLVAGGVRVMQTIIITCLRVTGLVFGAMLYFPTFCWLRATNFCVAHFRKKSVSSMTLHMSMHAGCVLQEVARVLAFFAHLALALRQIQTLLAIRSLITSGSYTAAENRLGIQPVAGLGALSPGTELHLAVGALLSVANHASFVHQLGGLDYLAFAVGTAALLS